MSRWTTSLIAARQGARILRGYLRIFRAIVEVGNCRTKRWHTDDETREIVTLNSLLLDPNKRGSKNAEIHEDGQQWWRTRTLESLANRPLHELIRIVMDHAIDALAERKRWSTVAWMTIEQAGMCTRRSRRALWRSQSACWSSLRPSVRSSRRLHQSWEGSGEIRMDRTRAMGIVDYWRDRGDEEGSLLFSCESIFGEGCARSVDPFQFSSYPRIWNRSLSLFYVRVKGSVTSIHTGAGCVQVSPRTLNYLRDPP